MGLFSRSKKKKQEPSNSGEVREEFAILQAEFDDLPWFASVNMFYKSFTNRKATPWHLYIEIDMKDTTEAGLPTDAEAEVLNPFQDELLDKIAGVSSMHYIGRVTYGGTRQLFAYVDDPESVNNLLQEVVNTPPYIREFSYSMEEDPEWKEVEVFYRS